MALSREEVKQIIKYVSRELKRNKGAYLTDGTVDFNKRTVGYLPAIRVSIADADNHFVSSTVEGALDETYDVISGFLVGSGVVNSINDLNSAVTISGISDIIVSTEGQQITVSGTKYTDSEAVDAVESAGLIFDDGALVRFSDAIATDHSATGFGVYKLAGEDFEFGDSCYVGFDWKFKKTKADSCSTMPAAYMAAETIYSGASGIFLSDGFARDDTWSWSGGVIYASSGIYGGLTQIKPTTVGHCIQIVAVALASNTIHFKSNFSFEELT